MASSPQVDVSCELRRAQEPLAPKDRIVAFRRHPVQRAPHLFLHVGLVVVQLLAEVLFVNEKFNHFRRLRRAGSLVEEACHVIHAKSVYHRRATNKEEAAFRIAPGAA